MIKMLKEEIKKYRKEFILGPFFKLIEALFELAIPFFMVKVIDDGIKKDNFKLVIIYIVIMLALCILGYLSALLCQIFATKAAFGIGTDMRNKVFSHINSLSFKELDTNSSNYYINILTNDIDQVQNALNMFIRLGIRAPFLVIGATALAFVINIKIGLIFVIIGLIITFFLVILVLKTIKHYKNINLTLDDISLSVKEGKRGSRIIRAFSNQEKELNKFKKKNNTYYKESNIIGFINSLFNPINYLIINLGILFVIYISGDKVNNGIMTQGETTALYNYLTQVLLALVIVVNLSVLFTKGYASYLRIKNIMNLNNSLKIEDKKLMKDDTIINFDNVSFYYNSNEKVLDTISFKVKKNDFVGIIGPTGSGKSTLINILSRFYDTTEGNIYLKGRNIKSYTNEEIRNIISLTSQNSNLFTGTIKDNFLMANKDLTDEDIYYYLKLAKADFIDRLKDGIYTNVLSNGNNFSGGEKQRLVIARSLSRKSEIIIFDDSNSALDYETDFELRKNLRKLNKTVIIISQRISSIKDCDEILVLNNGKLESIGSHKELLESNKFYLDIFISQGGEING